MSSAHHDVADNGFAPNDMRPIVATGSGANWGMWVFLAVLALGGAWLFSALTDARQSAQTPAVLLPAEPSSGAIASPDPLRLPERFLEPAEPAERPSPEQANTAPAPARQAPVVLQPQALPPLTSSRFPPPMAYPDPPRAAPQIVYSREASDPSQQSEAGDTSADRVNAGRLRNPSNTIPQGTVIPAVLETALDSTAPGGARALVQRDMYGFDGSRVLIPRGSRLYGEYEASLERGQNRARVQWTRLIRPDGVTIALDSPSSDPLGRAGIKGKVDGKFFQRFGSALLQSVLDVGVGLAVNEASDGVIVALPGSTQNVRISEQETIKPTLKVKHGTSVSVFVARDLDFSSVDP